MATSYKLEPNPPRETGQIMVIVPSARVLGSQQLLERILGQY